MCRCIKILKKNQNNNLSLKESKTHVKARQWNCGTSNLWHLASAKVSICAFKFQNSNFKFQVSSSKRPPQSLSINTSFCGWPKPKAQIQHVGLYLCVTSLPLMLLIRIIFGRSFWLRFAILIFSLVTNSSFRMKSLLYVCKYRSKRRIHFGILAVLFVVLHIC